MNVISMGIVIADCVARPVERTPRPGELELVDQISLCVGGSAANTGGALARLGLEVALVGRIGQDGFGDVLQAACSAAGCDTRFLLRGEVPTSVTLVSVDAQGERSFLHALGANAKLTAADLPLALLAGEGARALHVAGYFVLPGLEPQLPELFARASKLGLLTSLDNVWNPGGDSAGDNWARIHACLPVTDVYCPSLQEARRITGRERPVDVLDTLLDLGVRRAVSVKMGADGALIGSPDGTRLRLHGLEVRVVDGTGAGDAFIGGFLAALLDGEDLEQAGRLGTAAGALCVGAVGGLAGLKSLAETRALARAVRVEPLSPIPTAYGGIL